jgi:hypothetical protein
MIWKNTGLPETAHVSKQNGVFPNIISAKVGSI